MMFLLPLLTTTRLGFDGSVMKKHWSTWLASTHGSFFAVTFAPVDLDLTSGITMVVIFFYDSLGPCHTEHRHLLSTVVELPYVLDPSVKSFLDVIGVEYPHYPEFW